MNADFVSITKKNLLVSWGCNAGADTMFANTPVPWLWSTDVTKPHVSQQNVIEATITPAWGIALPHLTKFPVQHGLKGQ
jgi:hypothetical protein